MKNYPISIEKYQAIFAKILKISLAVFSLAFVYLIFFYDGPSGGLDLGFQGTDTPKTEVSTATELMTLVSMVSLGTSATSLIGFFITTAFAWRKEWREGKSANVELEKKRLEVEMLRLDIEKKRKENATGPDKPIDPS
jgi:uncharacterized membrane protein